MDSAMSKYSFVLSNWFKCGGMGGKEKSSIDWKSLSNTIPSDMSDNNESVAVDIVEV
jgi:hypothetical protein